MLSLDIQLIILLISILALFLFWLGWRLRKAWLNFLFWLRRRRGKRGETDAERLLVASGYRIIDSQVRLPGRIFIDGNCYKYDVRPDFTVEQNGITFLAEVKTGKAADPGNIQTRRQLMEYVRLGENDTVILVDASKKQVMKVSF